MGGSKVLRLALFIAVGGALATASSAGFAGVSDWQAKLSPSLRAKLASRSAGTFPAIVYLKEQADLSALSGKLEGQSKEARTRLVYDALRGVALKHQPALDAWLKKQGLRTRGYYISNFIAIENLQSSQIQAIAQREDVASVSGNPSFRIALPRGKATRDDNVGRAIGDNITATGAARVWQELNIRGENIVVAGQDTGYQWDHPALKANYRGWNGTTADHNYNWHDAIHSAVGGQSGTNPCGFNSAVPCDDDQHGTHTMGTMVGDDRGQNQIGMAPRAKWIGCHNMDRGAGAPTTYIECFQYFLAPYPIGGNPMTQGDPTKAPHVINNSWGCPASEGCTGAEMRPVMQALWNAGILVVASAGNDGPNCATIKDQPAQVSDLTLSVGALDHRNGNIASFSSRGPSALDQMVGPDVSAPGVNIRSSVPGNGYQGFMWSGTSMAGPHVVGQVALLWSARPALIGHLPETIALIRGSAVAKTSTQTCGGVAGSAIPNNTFGYGWADAFRSVSTALAQ